MKKESKKVIRKVEINVSTQEEKDILNKALGILDKYGFTICKKDSFIWDTQKN